MSEERKKILEMLAAGKISVDEAERLLSALGGAGPESGAQQAAASGRGPRFLRVEVKDGDDNVDVRVPLALIRAGMKFQSLIPEHAKVKIGEKLDEKGIQLDLGKLKSGDIEDLVAALSDLSVNVGADGGEKVKVYCE